MCAGVDMCVCSTMLFICVCIHTYAYCVSIMCTHVHVCVYTHCFAGQCHYDRMQCLWFCMLNWMLSGVWQELFVQCSEFNLG